MIRWAKVKTISAKSNPDGFTSDNAGERRKFGGVCGAFACSFLDGPEQVVLLCLIARLI